MGNCCGKGAEEAEERPSRGTRKSGIPSTCESRNPLVIKITDKGHFERILKETGEKKLIVADFFATWCGPCRRITPKIDDFATEFASTTVFIKIDVDENDELALTYGVSSMPTFILFLKGEKVEELTGANVEKLRELIEEQSIKVIPEPPMPNPARTSTASGASGQSK